MAQVQEEETVDQIIEETKKGGMSRGFFVAIFLILGVLVGGYFAFVKFIQPQILGTPAKQLEIPGTTFAKADQKAMGVMFPMEPFLVNLARSNGKQFLKVTLTLELSSADVHPEVEANAQKIMDSVLLLLSSKTFEDVISLQGKFKLKDEITTRVNRFLVMGHVKEVYFSEFIVQ